MEGIGLVVASVIGPLSVGGLAGYRFRLSRGGISNMAYGLMVLVPSALAAAAWFFSPDAFGQLEIWRMILNAGLGFVTTCLLTTKAEQIR